MQIHKWLIASFWVRQTDSSSLQIKLVCSCQWLLSETLTRWRVLQRYSFLIYSTFVCKYLINECVSSSLFVAFNVNCFVVVALLKFHAAMGNIDNYYAYATCTAYKWPSDKCCCICRLHVNQLWMSPRYFAKHAMPVNGELCVTGVR